MAKNQNQRTMIFTQKTKDRGKRIKGKTGKNSCVLND